MSKRERIKFDGPTGKWIIAHPGVETTVAKCEACGLHYKPSLGHACKKEKLQKMEEPI